MALRRRSNPCRRRVPRRTRRPRERPGSSACHASARSALLQIETNVPLHRVAKYAARQKRMHQAPTSGTRTLQRQGTTPATHAHFAQAPKTLPPCMPFPKHASTAQSSRSTPHTARQTVSTRKEGPRHGKVNNTRSKSHARGHGPWIPECSPCEQKECAMALRHELCETCTNCRSEPETLHEAQTEHIHRHRARKARGKRAKDT